MGAWLALATVEKNADIDNKNFVDYIGNPAPTSDVESGGRVLF